VRLELLNMRLMRGESPAQALHLGQQGFVLSSQRLPLLLAFTVGQSYGIQDCSTLVYRHSAHNHIAPG
jgi:hypothetical protein